MSVEAQREIRPIVIRWLIILGVTGILFVLILFQIRLHGAIQRNAHRAMADAYLHTVVAALKAYSTEYGTVISSDPAQILATLSGQNPHKIVFIEVRPDYINSNGELIDPLSIRSLKT